MVPWRHRRMGRFGRRRVVVRWLGVQGEAKEAWDRREAQAGVLHRSRGVRHRHRAATGFAESATRGEAQGIPKVDPHGQTGEPRLKPERGVHAALHAVGHVWREAHPLPVLSERASKRWRWPRWRRWRRQWQGRRTRLGWRRQRRGWEWRRCWRRGGGGWRWCTSRTASAMTPMADFHLLGKRAAPALAIGESYVVALLGVILVDAARRRQ